MKCEKLFRCKLQIIRDIYTLLVIVENYSKHCDFCKIFFITVVAIFWQKVFYAQFELFFHALLVLCKFCHFIIQLQFDKQNYIIVKKIVKILPPHLTGRVAV